MKKFLVVLVTIVCVCVAGASNAWDAKFTITTTNIAVNDEFGFYMSAAGTFYVDCGDGGVLSGDGVVGDTITRTGTVEALYKCTYSTAGIKTIRFSGLATEYYSRWDKAAIRFGNASDGADNATPGLVAGILGSIGQIFPTLGQSDVLRPTFAYSFARTNIVNIPANLLSGVTSSKYVMFFHTFDGCTSLTAIPSELFGNITTGADDMFDYTFAHCSSLVSIPENLFSSIATGAEWMFNSTFLGCSSLTTIPENLFGNITTGAAWMFRQTFLGCTSITSIPANLFGNITTAADSMFDDVFFGCTHLSGYIPPSAFAGLIANGAPYESGMWDAAFTNTNLATTCPSGTVQYITGYENYWDGAVSCIETCAGGGTELRTSSGLAFPLYGEKVTTPSLNLKFSNDAICYVPLINGVGGHGTLNVKMPDGTVLHANSVAGQ